MYNLFSDLGVGSLYYLNNGNHASQNNVHSQYISPCYYSNVNTGDNKSLFQILEVYYFPNNNTTQFVNLEVVEITQGYKSNISVKISKMSDISIINTSDDNTTDIFYVFEDGKKYFKECKILKLYLKNYRNYNDYFIRVNTNVLTLYYKNKFETGMNNTKLMSEIITEEPSGITMVNKLYTGKSAECKTDSKSFSAKESYTFFIPSKITITNELFGVVMLSNPPIEFSINYSYRLSDNKIIVNVVNTADYTKELPEIIFKTMIY